MAKSFTGVQFSVEWPDLDPTITTAIPDIETATDDAWTYIEQVTVQSHLSQVNGDLYTRFENLEQKDLLGLFGDIFLVAKDLDKRIKILST